MRDSQVSFSYSTISANHGIEAILGVYTNIWSGTKDLSFRFVKPVVGEPYSWASTPDKRKYSVPGGPYSFAGLYQWESILAGASSERDDFHQRPAL